MNLFDLYLHRGVEQLVARRAHNPKVAGSSPVPATKEKPVNLTLAGFFSLEDGLSNRFKKH